MLGAVDAVKAVASDVDLRRDDRVNVSIVQRLASKAVQKVLLESSMAAAVDQRIM